MSYSSEVLADAPVGYWRFGEPSGTNANDEAGTNDGTYQNTPTLGVAGALTGDADTAVTLNGTTQYVTVPAAAPLDIGDTGSVEAWVKLTATLATIFSKGSTGPYVGVNSTGKIFVEREADLGLGSSTTSVNDGAWHHVVVTKNGGLPSIWIDAVDRTGTMSAGAWNTTTDQANIGRRQAAADLFFNGTIDEVALYPTALSSARILAHFTAASATVAPVHRSLVPIPFM